MGIIPYLEEQILHRLQFENPWWVSGKVDEFYEVMQPRAYFEPFFSLVYKSNIRRAVILMGSRRIGKTVMMYHAVKKLLVEKVDPLKIAFVSIDTPIYTNIGLERLFELCRKATGREGLDGWYIFFDEIQYLKDWEVHLKSLVDSYPKARFIVSGSAAAALQRKSNESGAGRFTEFTLPSLTFFEFLLLKNLRSLISFFPSKEPKINSHNLSELNKQFIEYVNFGGYPEVIFSQEIRNDPVRYIRNDIIDKVLLRDLPMLYGITDVQELNSLFNVIAYNTGNEFSLENLHKDSLIDKIKIKKYLEYLEAAFLIKVVHKIADKPKKFKRITQFKIYLTNSSLRSALFSPLASTDNFFGNMVETALCAQYLANPSNRFKFYYARWQGGEVDVVNLDEKTLKPESALEIKWSNRYYDKPKELKSLIKFLKDNKLKTALVTTIDEDGEKIIDENLKLIFVPAAIHALTIETFNFFETSVKIGEPALFRSLTGDTSKTW